MNHEEAKARVLGGVDAALEVLADPLWRKQVLECRYVEGVVGQEVEEYLEGYLTEADVESRIVAAMVWLMSTNQ
jgi:hypothetical protein